MDSATNVCTLSDDTLAAVRHVQWGQQFQLPTDVETSTAAADAAAVVRTSPTEVETGDVST